MSKLNKIRENAKLGALGLAFVTAVGLPLYSYNASETVCFTVTDKERATVGRGENIRSQYRVTTEDSTGNIEIFKNVDAWLRLKFNSADVQGALKVDHSYTANVYGWRFGLLSMLRNISSATPVASCPAPKP